MPIVVGLTGGIATGKSTVSTIWRSAGAHIVDADAVARSVVTPGRLAPFLIRRVFGDSVFLPNGTLDRPALGRLIFAEPRARGRLDAIMHPLITLAMLRELVGALLGRQAVVVLDTPLLYETRVLVPFCSAIVVVACGGNDQVRRLQSRNAGLSEEEVRERINSQMPLAEKVARAEFVLNNSGSIESLERDSRELLESLRPSYNSECVVQASFLGVAVAVCVFAASTLLKLK